MHDLGTNFCRATIASNQEMHLLSRLACTVYTRVFESKSWNNCCCYSEYKSLRPSFLAREVLAFPPYLYLPFSYFHRTGYLLALQQRTELPSRGATFAEFLLLVLHSHPIPSSATRTIHLAPDIAKKLVCFPLFYSLDHSCQNIQHRYSLAWHIADSIKKRHYYECSHALY